MSHLARVVLAVIGLLAVTATASAQQPTTTRVSVSSTGTQADGSSADPSVSADGRFVAFESSAENLDSQLNDEDDIYLRDRLTGQTRLLTVTPPDAEDSDDSNSSPDISADGRFVVFESELPLTGGPAEDRLFRWDRVAQQYALVPLSAGYAFPGSPVISNDGSKIAFEAFDTTGDLPDIFWADMTTGEVRRVSETAAGARGAPYGSFGSFDPAMSGDGRWVGFTTEAKNLVPDSDAVRDVVARDMVGGGGFARISLGAGNAAPNSHSSTPALSFDGCLVAFFSDATNLVAGDDDLPNQVYVRDRCASDTELASLKNNEDQGRASPQIDISDDGCRVVFPSAQVVSPAPADGSGLALRDRCAGSTTRLDLRTTGEPGTGRVDELAISAGTGRYVVFTTDADDLVDEDTEGNYDVFLRDRASNTPPVAELSLAQEGRRVTATATTSRDPDGFLLTGEIAFGDGTPAQTGLQAIHDYERGGTYGVTVTVTDADGISRTATLPVIVPDAGGGTGPPPGPVPPSNGPPLIPPPPIVALALDGVALSRAKFGVVPAGGSPAGRRGAELTLRLSVPATVTLAFQRKRRGRRVGGRCVRRARRGARCTLYTDVGTSTHSLPAGTSEVPITGLVGSRALGRGRYRLRITALSADAQTAGPRDVSFKIIKIRRARG